MSTAKLIVIDDEPDMAELVAEVARDVGYDVWTATNADEFRALYVEHAPDVIVSDVVMPGTDGIELLNELADDHTPSTLILISGYDGTYLQLASRLAEKKGLRLGQVLTKPFPLVDMQKALQAALPDQ